MGVAVLAGVAALLVSRRDRLPPPGPPASGVRALAVLPFENLGSPEDEYFADGVTDELRGKLAAVPGLLVIASTSSNQYKKTTKTPRQIAGELGVQYLLVGKVRWDKQKDGESRVRVSPELVDATTASTRWQQPFDPTSLVAHMATWWDLFWVLNDEQQRLLLRLPPGPFGDDRLAWGLALAQTAELRGDLTRTRQFAEEARSAAEAHLKESPLDAEQHVLLGLALAYLGRKAEAVREGERRRSWRNDRPPRRAAGRAILRSCGQAGRSVRYPGDCRLRPKPASIKRIGSNSRLNGFTIKPSVSRVTAPSSAAS